MQKVLSGLLLGIVMVVGALLPATMAGAVVSCPPGSINTSAPSYAECNTQETTGDDSLMSRVKTIINVAIGILGVGSTAMIIIGGVMYTTSQGQPDKTKQAKDVIVYSVIGLVVALLAFAIVNFVLVSVFNTSV